MFASAKIYAYILSTLYVRVAAHKRKRNARVHDFLKWCFCTHFGTECMTNLYMCVCVSRGELHERSTVATRSKIRMSAEVAEFL